MSTEQQYEECRKTLGREHWAVFAYLETCCVENRGEMSRDRLNDADFIHLDALEEAGLLEQRGTGLHPRGVLTPLGWEISYQIRRHKGTGGSFGTFVPKWHDVLVLLPSGVELLREALDSHVYWQLSDTHYRRDMSVDAPGSDDPEKAENIKQAWALRDVLEAAPRAP